MLVLKCEIIIDTQSGQTITYDYVSDINIVTSIINFTDTCKITVPKKIKYKEKDITSYIRKNDKITVKLGYLNQINTVFKGYIKSISTDTPIEILCENESYVLKQKKVAPTLYDSLKLKDFINEYLPEYETKVTDVNLGEIRIANETSVANVLDFIAKKYPLRFYFKNDIFYAGLPTALLQDVQNVIKFKKGVNFEKNNLQYTLADDINVQIVAKAILKDNTALEAKVPENAEKAEIHTFYDAQAETIEDLKIFANEKLLEFKKDKMTGSFTAFGVPYVQKGDVVHLFDDLNKERNDKQFVAEKVVYNFGQSGYSQEITLGDEIK
ncbi:MAG: hypothetical protein JXL97_03570 [Bacteroidales bacterium]|nr:hypothetical protein [Bacteroidales bacterium]